MNKNGSTLVSLSVLVNKGHPHPTQNEIFFDQRSNLESDLRPKSSRILFVHVPARTDLARRGNIKPFAICDSKSCSFLRNKEIYFFCNYPNVKSFMYYQFK